MLSLLQVLRPQKPSAYDFVHEGTLIRTGNNTGNKISTYVRLGTREGQSRLGPTGSLRNLRLG